jgi:hypothetical protein
MSIVLVSSTTKCHSTCFKTVKKSLRYLLLFESDKEIKIGSDFSKALYSIFYIKTIKSTFVWKNVPLNVHRKTAIRAKDKEFSSKTKNSLIIAF